MRLNTIRRELKRHLKKGGAWKGRRVDQRMQEMGLADLKCQRSNHSCHCSFGENLVVRQAKPEKKAVRKPRRTHQKPEKNCDQNGLKKDCQKLC